MQAIYEFAETYAQYERASPKTYAPDKLRQQSHVRCAWMRERAGMRRLYGHRLPRQLLETRCLREWVKVYHINDFPPATKLSTFQKAKIYCAVSMRTSVTCLCNCDDRAVR